MGERQEIPVSLFNGIPAIEFEIRRVEQEINELGQIREKLERLSLLAKNVMVIVQGQDGPRPQGTLRMLQSPDASNATSNNTQSSGSSNRSYEGSNAASNNTQSSGSSNRSYEGSNAARNNTQSSDLFNRRIETSNDISNSTQSSGSSNRSYAVSNGRTCACTPGVDCPHTRMPQTPSRTGNAYGPQSNYTQSYSGASSASPGTYNQTNPNTPSSFVGSTIGDYRMGQSPARTTNQTNPSNYTSSSAPGSTVVQYNAMVPMVNPNQSGQHTQYGSNTTPSYLNQSCPIPSSSYPSPGSSRRYDSLQESRRY